MPAGDYLPVLALILSICKYHKTLFAARYIYISTYFLFLVSNFLKSISFNQVVKQMKLKLGIQSFTTVLTQARSRCEP